MASLIEFVSSKILYERNLSYNCLDDENLALLVQGLKTGLDLTCAKLKNGEFKMFSFNLKFMIIEPEKAALLYPIFGRYCLFPKKQRFDSISKFRKKYISMLNEIKQIYRENNGFDLEVLVTGFRDSIIHKTDALDPFSN